MRFLRLFAASAALITVSALAFAGCASDEDDESPSSGSPGSSSSGAGASGGEGGSGAAQGGAGGAGGGSASGGAGGQGGEATGGAGGVGGEGGAGGQGGEGGGGTCGVIGQDCVTGCGVDAQCWDGPASDFCGPITPGCGGFAGAQCPGTHPICMFFQGGDYGPCFTQEEKECVCAGLGKSNLTGC